MTKLNGKNKKPKPPAPAGFTTPELLAPAGDLEKMKIALEFGADAVYFGLPNFSLRARINKFGRKEIEEAAEICRSLGKKFYLTINVYAHNRHIKELPKHLKFIQKVKPDAVIVSDSGVLRIIKQELPEQEIHLSTQANATNIEAVKFWQEQGISRVILARELNLKEIEEIKEAVPEMELETFVHGAMCMAYSGRCLLSKWMTNRSANLGDCAQPCRWSFTNYESDTNIRMDKDSLGKVCSFHSAPNLRRREDAMPMATVVDDQRRFSMDLEGDEQGTYFFNSYDVNLIEHLDKLVEAGVDAFKIEGRNKSVYYVATVTRAYRKVIDALVGEEENLKKIIQEQKKELTKLSHRGYWTGFILDDQPPQLTEKPYEKTNWEFVGASLQRGTRRNLARKNVDEKTVDKNTRQVLVHNALKQGDEVETITPEENIETKIVSIENDEGEIESAHGGQGKIFKITFDCSVRGSFLLRKKS